MLARLLYFLPVLLLGLTFGQGPEFAQQYRQRLGGALDELRAAVVRFDADAARQGLAPAAALARLEANPEPLARDRAADMRLVVARRDRLQRQKAAFDGGGLSRLAAAAGDFDSELARAALADFRPALPVTLDGLAAAGLGALVGLGLAEAGRLTFVRARRRRLRRRG